MISVDTIYQRVLAMANKEQRGYITPQEFNLIANQAQIAIFEQYFYDLDQAKRDINNDESTFSDIPELIKNKLTPFITIENLPDGGTFPLNYRTGRVFASTGGSFVEAKKMDYVESQSFQNSRFHKAGLRRNPIYRESHTSGRDIDVITHNGIVTNTGIVKVEIISKPQRVKWGYDVIANKALYNASHSTDFQLHDSEETTLVYRILSLAGLTIKSQDLVNVGQSLENKKIQQEKM